MAVRLERVRGRYWLDLLDTHGVLSFIHPLPLENKIAVLPADQTFRSRG